jgi:hypothetical protein
VPFAVVCSDYGTSIFAFKNLEHACLDPLECLPVAARRKCIAVVFVGLIMFSKE